MDYVINVERLISEIEKRPSLWDMKKKEYSDRIIRKHCWEEITSVFANDGMTEKDLKDLGITLQKKWKNIRDNFSKELRHKKMKTGPRAVKKSPYLYTKHLEFIRNAMESKDTTNSEEDQPVKEEYNEVRPLSSCQVTAVQPGIVKKRLHPVEDLFVSSLDLIDNDIIKEQAKDDDNRHFLLSMLPTLSSLPKRINSKCRLELLEVLNKYEELAFVENEQNT